MIRTVDALTHVDALFDGNMLNMQKWESYMGNLYPDAVRLLKEDVESCLAGGEYTFEKDFLPVICAVKGHEALPVLRENFARAVTGLNERIREALHCTLDADIVLYLGLCNAAGWVTELGGRRVILLGAEKILELSWYHQDALYGLIYHELGHIYQDQHGVLHRECTGGERFIWQLFTEGVAMHAEQLLVGKRDYFHQDRDGWQNWCRANLRLIAEDFDRDLPSMTRENQRYFGDWVDYRGHGDVGYYLGEVFVQYCLKQYALEELILLNADKVTALWRAYLRTLT
ncbi:MAG: hypothetical protein E7326_03900 [Clostridiales bacterium]|nr:hypothetical protein [Clostridiales bacterium]